MGFLEQNYTISTFIFFKGLGVIYFLAFFSLLLQVEGLFCSNGISPIGALVKYIEKIYGKRGFLKAPSIFFYRYDDAFIKFCVLMGVFLSLFLAVGIATPFTIFFLWAIYLSFVSLGQEFLSYQWDVLLLEVSVLGFFLSLSSTPPALGIFCLQFFLFRFLFSSGYWKIRTDKNWRNLTSMRFHFETQPLPNPLSWYFHQFAIRFSKSTTFLVLFLELAVPFLFFGPPNIKILGFFLTLFLQVLIIFSGNYCFFNLLTILLQVFLINDNFYSQNPFYFYGGTNIFLEIIFGILIFLNVLRFLGLFFKKFEAIRILPAFCFSNSYGLFAMMTTKRYEINLEGSMDGSSWKKIPFKYKMEDPKIGGIQIAPLQPRLDWQMWFLALDPNNLSPWFNDFLEKIFKGSKEAVSLLGDYPFKETPPKKIRISVCLYRYSTFAERKQNKNFWKVQTISSFLVEP